MAKYHFTNKAVEDLSEIWNYTLDKYTEKQADKYFKFLLASCQELADNPKFGKNYDILSKDLLGFKSQQHIIFFKIMLPKEIEVIRILHGRMDLKSKFR